MCPRSRAMSQSRRGSVALSRAADSRTCALPAWPHAHALRAAAKRELGASGPGRSERAAARS